MTGSGRTVSPHFCPVPDGTGHFAPHIFACPWHGLQTPLFGHVCPLSAMKTRLTSVLVFVFFTAPCIAQAQNDADSMREGILAFRDGRYEAAERAFERITERDPTQAEAYFLLARLYTETPLENRSKANRALDRALDLEPDNLTYLVGRLQQLREETWNFIAEKIREQKRIDLSRRILKLDPTNAFAHEELGAAFIRDFWRYRNAVMLPTLRFGGSVYRVDSNIQGPVGSSVLAPQSAQDAAEGGALGVDALARQTDDLHVLDPSAVFLADRFDVDALERLGVPVQDLAGRAQRAYDNAIEHLRASLATDPRRRSVYDRLMEIFALKGEYGEALEMLEDMYAFYADDPQTWLYLGLAHYRAGSMDAAAKSFETAFKYVDAEGRDALESLEYLISSAEKGNYQKDPVAYASRFWTSKDPRYLTPYNERKMEHFSRLVYADLLYGSDDLGLRGWDTQRGRILVRYGIPSRDVVIIPQSTSRINVGGDVASDSEIPSPSLRSGNPEEERLRRRALQGSGFNMLDEANTFNIWDYGDFRFVFEDPFRNGEYRLYSPSASEVSAGHRPWINDYVLLARETFEREPERYEYSAPGRQIELPYLVSAFKGTDRNADLYVNYGIPITDEGIDQETIGITANVGAFLISAERDILVERRRTVYGLRGTQVRSFAEANLWVDTQPMQAPPGSHQVSMEFETTSGNTVAVQRREVKIPDFSGDELNVSDVMLAYRIEESLDDAAASDGDVLRNGLSISPAPWSVFSAKQPIYLYFEVYNLASAAEGRSDYEMEAVLTAKDQSRGLKKLFRNVFGGRDGVSVRLPGSGTVTDEGHYLILDAANQETGLYTLTLRVEDNVSGRSVEREQDLYLE